MPPLVLVNRKRESRNEKRKAEPLAQDEEAANDSPAPPTSRDATKAATSTSFAKAGQPRVAPALRQHADRPSPKRQRREAPSVDDAASSDSSSSDYEEEEEEEDEDEAEEEKGEYDARLLRQLVEQNVCMIKQMNSMRMTQETIEAMRGDLEAERTKLHSMRVDAALREVDLNQRREEMDAAQGLVEETLRETAAERQRLDDERRLLIGYIEADRGVRARAVERIFGTIRWATDELERVMQAEQDAARIIDAGRREGEERAATAGDLMDHMHKCPVCYDPVYHRGTDAQPLPSIHDKVPWGMKGRRFPCGHVMCTKCFMQCIRPAITYDEFHETVGHDVTCPQCRAVHEVGDMDFGL
jgi:hypothetical protein